MRAVTVSEMKGVKAAVKLHHSRPTPGTRAGDIYDRLMSSKGIPIEIGSQEFMTIMVALTDYYGLDIRHVQRANKRLGLKSKYVLAGEWFGRVYIDYIAERIGEHQ